MQDIKLVRAILKLDNSALCVDRLTRTTGPCPKNIVNPLEPVPSTVFGYWVDITEENKHVIYRRYITNSIPMNLKHTCKLWDKKHQKLRRFKIDVPEIARAKSLEIYEQYLENENDKHTTIKHHLSIDLSDTKFVMAMGLYA